MSAARVLLLVGALSCSPAATAPAEPVVIEVGKPGSQPPEEPREEAPAVDAKACIAGVLEGKGVESAGPDADLFADAVEYLEGGDTALARKTLLELTETHRASAFVPLAYIHFGEMFAREAEADPLKLALASQFYLEAIKRPPPENRGYYYAWHRLGLIHMQTGEHGKAMEAFVAVLRGWLDYPEVGCVRQLAIEARALLTKAYVHVGSWKKAFSFFKSLAAEEALGEQDTLLWLVELADAYMPVDEGAAKGLVQEIALRAAQPDVCSELRALFAKHPALRLSSMPFCTP